MSDLVDADDIERIVSRERHPTDHYARAVSAESTVYILHSQECRDSGIDLRDCVFSRALDMGIDGAPWSAWRRVQDRAVRVVVAHGYLIPDLMDRLRAALSGESKP